jgi:flagellar hook-basal body complex protein FliE
MNPVSLKTNDLSKGADIGAVSSAWAKEISEPTGSVPAQEGFSSLLASEMGKIFSTSKEVDASVAEYNAGGDGASIERTAFLMAKAESEMRVAVQVRNKVVSAYQEVMNLQI